MKKSDIAILVGIIIVASYILNLNKKEEMKVEQKNENKEVKEVKENKQGGWWNNVINCKANGDNNLYCKPKEKWIFPY